MDKFFIRVLHAITWLIIGMVFMARFYCNSLNITSGPLYIGWDTVAVTLGGLAGMHLLLWIDPVK